MKTTAIVFVFLLAPICTGQSIETTVGGSQMLGMVGAQSTFHDSRRFGWTGVGYQDGVRSGAYLNIPVKMFSLADVKPFRYDDKYRLGIGDQYLDSSLTVDEYGHTFSARGVSLLYHTKFSDIQAFTGIFSQDEAQPYLHSVQQFDMSPAGAVIGRFELSKTVSLRSLNIAGNGLTSIQSLRWSPTKSWNLNTAAGVGSNHGYLANETDYQNDHLRLRASYTVASHSFHRQDGYNFDVEPLGLNCRIEIHAGEDTTIQFNHMHDLMVVPKYLYAQNASIGTQDEAGFTTSFLGVRAGADVSINSSDSYMGKQYTGVVSLYRRILPRWSSSISYARNASSSQNGEAYQGRNDFRLSNHLDVSQNFSRLNGVNNNTFGGQWSSNLLSLSVDNQIYTSQVAAQFGQKSMFQAWTFSLRLRTPHGTTTHLETTVDPLGRVQWGGYLSGMRYHGIGDASDPGDNAVTFSKYIIKGAVVDVDGKGVWGIAVSVGGNTVISGSDGEFFMHVKNSKPQPVSVLPESSLLTSRWSLTSAPPTARGFLDGKTGDPVRVVVQMGRRVVSEKSEPKITLQSQRPNESTSARNQAPTFQTVKPAVSQKLDDIRVIEPEPEPEPEATDVRQKVPALLFARHFVIQEGPGIVDYELPKRTSETSASDQVRDLQAAVEALRAPAAGHSEKRLEVRPAGMRPAGKSGKVLRVLCRIISFGLIGKTHKEPGDM